MQIIKLHLFKILLIFISLILIVKSFTMLPLTKIIVYKKLRNNIYKKFNEIHFNMEEKGFLLKN